MEKQVAFYSQGLRLAGKLYLPEGRPGARGWPGLVMCAGFTGIKDAFLGTFAERFVAAGFACLAFDYRYFGESQGEPRWRLLPLCQVEDAQTALSFLQLQPGVDPERIGLYGISFGGAIVSYTAGVDRRVRSMVSVGGIGNGERWLRGMRPYWQWQELLQRLAQDRKERILQGTSAYVDTLEIMLPDPGTRAFWDKTTPLALKSFPQWGTRITLESAEAVIAFKPETVTQNIAPGAALWIHAKGDSLVPVEESQAMYERAKEPKELALLDCGHWGVYRGEPFERVTQQAVDWFRRWLSAE